MRRWQECAYASAEWGLSGVETFVRLHLLFYLTNVLGIAPATAGFLVAAGVFWDALIDPLVGWWSDSTRGRWGARFPFMTAGLGGLPLFMIVLFLPGMKEISSETRIAAAFAIYLLLNSAMTLISVPHAALAGDLSRDEAVRTRLFAWRYFFTTLGLLSGIAIPAWLLTRAGAEAAQPYWQSAIGLALIVLLSTGMTLVGTRKLPRAIEASPHDLITQARLIGKNKPFLILFLAMVLATIGQAVNSSLALYYYRYRLAISEGELQSILVVFTLVIIASIIVWNLLSKRFEKKILLCLGVGGLGVLGSIVYPLLPSGKTEGPMLMGIVGGILVGSVFLLEVMVADSVDAEKSEGKDSAASGVNEAAPSNDYGAYFGLWKLGTKLARALAIGFSGILLGAIGFDPASAPTEKAREGLAYLFGPGVGLFFILGALVILFYPKDQSAGGRPKL